MTASRLTDEQLTRIANNVEMASTVGDVTVEVGLRDARSMLAELKDRRARDLTTVELLLMREFRAHLCETLEPSPATEAALAILGRLLASGGGS